MKFKLECNQYNDCIVTHEFSEELLPEIIKQFEFFLKGCGFQITTVDYEIPMS